MLTKIYQNLGVPVHSWNPAAPPAVGEVAVHYDKATGVGTIQVNRIGVDTIAGNLPGAAGSQRSGRRRSGRPRFAAEPGRHSLSLRPCRGKRLLFFRGPALFCPRRRLLAATISQCRLDLERLRLFAPFAQELLDYILADRERVRQIQRT